MSQRNRIAGGLVDRDTTLTFRFNGKAFEGHPGDTLASALLANCVQLVGRSFKYHRPRGIFSAGSEEPNALVQLELAFDYGSNLSRYPAWQSYLRKHQPPTLIVWGKNDHIFPAEGAYPYKRDLQNIEFHLLDTGHFALEEEGDFIAAQIRSFLGKHVGDAARRVAAN